MQLFTIGYADKSFSEFISYLKRHGITALVDVRSSPYSNMYSEYNADLLRSMMSSHMIEYMEMGKFLGPRSPYSEHYDENGQVDFRKLAKSEEFIKGVSRIELGIDKGFKIAMMCAEKDAATCHRSILIADNFLNARGVDVGHITFDGSIELQSEIESRLAIKHGFVPDMFMTEDECKANAITEQAKKVAYKRS